MCLRFPGTDWARCEISSERHIFYTTRHNPLKIPVIIRKDDTYLQRQHFRTANASPILIQLSVVLARAIGAQLTAMSSDHFPFFDVEDTSLGSPGESTADALLQMAVERAASLDLTVEGNIDTTFIPLANADRVPLQPFPPLLRPAPTELPRSPAAQTLPSLNSLPLFLSLGQGWVRGVSVWKVDIVLGAS